MSGGGAFLAQYNGFPSGSEFTQLLTAPISVGAFESASVNDEYGFASFGGPVSNMSSRIEFSLTSEDFASGSSTYQIIPEPAAALLLLAGLVVLRRR
jgi:MYXO-CTERM domain-containing protein